jgi:hypothetical protein
MVDLSTIPTEELLRLRQSRGSPAASPLTGVSTEELLRLKQQRAKPPVGIGEDMGRGGASGFLQGGLDLLGSIVNPAGALTQGGDFENFIERTSGRDFYEAKMPPGRVAQLAMKTVPFAVAGGGGGTVAKIAKDALRFGLAPGTAAGVAGEVAKDTPYEVPAQLAAGVATGLAPSVLRRAITPRNIPAVRSENAKYLRSEGVDNLTEGNVTGNPAIQARERKAQGFFYDPYVERVKQLEKFTAASLGKSGILAKRAGPEVMDDTFNRVGKRFDDLAEQNAAKIDTKTTDDVVTAFQAYADLGPPAEKVDALRGFVDRISKVMDPQGIISGRAYKSLRSGVEKAARSSSDPDYSGVLRDLKNALDDAMERAMIAAQSPDVGEWRKIREQYRNLLVIEKAVGGTSKEAAEGLITPQALRGAVATVHGRRNMVRGKGPFEKISRAGSMILGDLPLTGYAPVNAKSIWETVWIPFEAMQRGIRDIRMTRPVQEWLTNRKMPPPGGVSDIARSAAPAVPMVTNVRRDKNGIPILDERGQPIPVR